MKYIMFRCTGYDKSVVEVPIIFPKMMIHRHVAGQLSSTLRNQHNYEKVEIVSAGECNIHCFSVSGGSETLSTAMRKPIVSRPADREVIQHNDQFHGIVDDAELELVGMSEEALEALKATTPTPSKQGTSRSDPRSIVNQMRTGKSRL